MIVAVLAIAILDLLGVLIAAAAGVKSLWPVLGALPLVGLPLGMLLIIALLIVSARRRSRETQTLAKSRK